MLLLKKKTHLVEKKNIGGDQKVFFSISFCFVTVRKFVSSLVWEIKQCRQNFRSPTCVIGSDHYIPFFPWLPHQAFWFDPIVLLFFYIYPILFHFKWQLMQIHLRHGWHVLCLWSLTNSEIACLSKLMICSKAGDLDRERVGALYVTTIHLKLQTNLHHTYVLNS